MQIRFWKDLAKSEPARHGDRVACAENIVCDNGRFFDLVMEDPKKRPILVVDHLEFCGGYLSPKHSPHSPDQPRHAADDTLPDGL